MIADLKPYTEYKESGSRWLANVPSHWEVRNLRTLIRPRNERNHPDLPLLSVAREKGVFVRSLTDANENHNVIPEDLSNYKVARAGSLVINKMKAWQGSMGITPSDGIVSPAYFVFDFSISNRAFGQALLRSKPYVAHFWQASDGVRVGQWDLTIAGMRQIPVLVPSPPEQAAIVRFLDWVNGRLERAIRAKRKVIALLNEQKQAIIHCAVTLGDHLGWRSFPMRAVLRPVKRVGFSDRTLLSLFRDFGVVPKDSRENKNVDVRDLALCQFVQSGDVVMNKMKAWQGSIAVSDLEGIVSPDYMVLKFVSDQFAPKFFHYLLRSPEMVAEYRRRAYGVRPGQWRLMYPEFCRLQVLVPPTKEQVAIAHSIELAVAGINKSTIQVRREIELLREYRTRLVADVVTGKLDVREAAMRLPEEHDKSDLSDLSELDDNADEPEPEDEP
jgi:type I restriction enzyme, S subunit